jgi:hypothetical protein
MSLIIFVSYTIFFTARMEEQQSFWQALMVLTECKKQLQHPNVICLYSRLLLSLSNSALVVRDISLPAGVPVESHGSTEEVTHESPCLIVAYNEHSLVHWLY